MTPELQSILAAHAEWTAGDPTGQRADLRGADLRGASLIGADLRGADLSGANLRGAKLPITVTVPHIDAAILSAIETEGSALDMSNWHRCDTTHCRAGWAITLAGEAGRALEASLGPSAAAALIYASSRPDKPVPNWIASNEDAIADIRACAAADPLTEDAR